MAVLGAGAFGQVTLVKREGQYNALKTLAKMHIVQTGLTVRHSHTAVLLHALILQRPLHLITGQYLRSTVAAAQLAQRVSWCPSGLQHYQTAGSSAYPARTSQLQH